MTRRHTIPGGTMKMATARKRWDAVFDAAMSGDPEAMERAVSVFQPIVATFFMDEVTRAAIIANISEAVAREREACAALMESDDVCFMSRHQLGQAIRARGQ